MSHRLPAGRSRGQSPNELYAPGVAVILAPAGCHDCLYCRHQGEDAKADHHKNTDQHEGQQQACQHRDEECYLEVHGLPGIVVDKAVLVFFHQPDDQRPDDISERNYASGKHRHMAEHAPVFFILRQHGFVTRHRPRVLSV